MKCAQYTALALLFAIWPIPMLSAQESSLSAVLHACSSVVSIRADYGEIYGGTKKPFINPETGQIIVTRNARGYKYVRNGAGIIIGLDGIIATNHHTVENAKRIQVTLHDGTSLYAEPVFSVPSSDVVLLKIDTDIPLDVVEFSDSDTVRLNDEVYGIGSSKMLKNTVSGGRVSGIGTSRDAKARGITLVNLIRIDFDVYKGDSGSPILDPSGKFLGFVSAAPAHRHGITYAIPSNTILMHYQTYLESLTP